VTSLPVDRTEGLTGPTAIVPGLALAVAIAVGARLLTTWIPSIIADVTVAILLGLVVAAAAVVGDLVESLLKRDARLKDAGWILPGMGGVLDRIDSALLAIPVTYYLLVAYYYALYVA